MINKRKKVARQQWAKTQQHKTLYFAGKIDQSFDWRLGFLKKSNRSGDLSPNDINYQTWCGKAPDLQLIDYPNCIYGGPFFEGGGHTLVGNVHGQQDRRNGEKRIDIFAENWRLLEKADGVFAWLQGTKLADYEGFDDLLGMLDDGEICEDSDIIGLVFESCEMIGQNGDLRLQRTGNTIQLTIRELSGLYSPCYYLADNGIYSALETDAFGTLVELGFAYKANIPIYLGVQCGLASTELWYAHLTAFGMVYADSALAAFDGLWHDFLSTGYVENSITFVSPHLRRLPYGAQPTDRAHDLAEQYGFTVP